MNKSEIAMCLAPLVEIYSNLKVNEISVEVWQMAIGRYSLDQFKAALKEHTITSEFAPTPASIVNIIQSNLPAEKTAVEAFAEVQKAVGRFGWYNAEDALKSLDNKIGNAIGGAEGFKSFCMSPEADLPIYRAQFKAAYDTFIQREAKETRREAMIGTKLSDLISDTASKLSIENKR